MRQESNLIFCLWISCCPSIICWKDYQFPMTCLDTLLENQLTIDVMINFWTLNSIWSVCLFLWQYYTVLITVDLIVSFEIRKHEYLKFVLLFKDLAILGLLSFQMNLRNSLSISAKKLPGILIGINAGCRELSLVFVVVDDVLISWGGSSCYWLNILIFKYRYWQV